MALATIDEALQMATRFHQAGDLEKAESIYRQILSTYPDQPDALHRMGVIALQTGQKQAALQLIDQAIAINPQSGEYYCNRGMALAALGRPKEAIEAYQRALTFRRDYAQVHNNLGNALQAEGRLDEAIESFREALRVDPGYAEAHNNLGNVYQSRGRRDEAVAAYARAVEIRPGFVEAISNLGGALVTAGRPEEAIVHCRKALELRPQNAGAYSNLGYALRGAGHTEEAITAYRTAIAIQPSLVEAYNGLGNIFLLSGRIKEAIELYRKALSYQPNHLETLYNLGIALHAGLQIEEAIVAFRRMLALAPERVEAMNNLAIALQAHNEVEEAVALIRKAVTLRPDFASAFHNLGNALKDLGRIPDAIDAYDRAIQLQPDDMVARSNRLYSLHFHPDYSAADILRQAMQWNERSAAKLPASPAAHENDRDPERRLRIGYVSPDFRRHCQSFFTIPLLAAHDHSRYEIFCYANVTTPDSSTERIQGLADVWRSTVGMNDEKVARMVSEDRIDILVDLTMHMAYNRAMLFARKPAPVQVAWLAYPGTTGMAAMDYRLTDPYLDPPGMNDAYYTEKSVRLPDTFWCFDPTEEELPVGPPPSIAAGHVTFGCLNNFCKINRGTLQLWGRVMAATPNSRLILLSPKGSHRRTVIGDLGVDESRVEFVEYQQRPQYLRTYHRIDIGLDTLPYNGHTTSLDSCWMGVPVVTLLGKTVAGRAGWSQLCNLNLKELATRSEEQFVQTASSLASDQPRLVELRSTLRERLRNSPLMDAERFARNIEAAYREMWRRWAWKKSD